MSTSKLTRSSSSLSRSPTIKSGIDSLSSLEEALVVRTPERVDRTWHEEAGIISSREKRLRIWVLLPSFLLVIVPCTWWYIRVAQPQELYLPSNDLVLGVWFDCLALLLLILAVVASIRMVYPHLFLVYRLKGTVCKSWAGLITNCVRPVAMFLMSDKFRKEKASGSTAVTWTIGSKPKLERTRVVREGVQVYSNGDAYEGEFHQGRCSGSGVYHFYMSGRYEGEWVDGKYDGYGVETWARGSRYRGQYRQGLRNGYGVYRFYTGDVYSGEWSNGQSHGRGVQTCQDGSRYVGEFKWGVKHGFGHYYFRNGDTYAGEYFADKMHGYGVYQFANGHLYEGAWHEGKRQGLGMYTFRNGETQAGYWHGGTLKTASTQNPLPGVHSGINHTKVLNVVQEARRAAAKAYEVPQVDDRVNRAVAAANRAANAARVAAVKAVQKKMQGSLHV